MDDAANRTDPVSPEPMDGGGDTRSIGRILGDIVADFRALMRDEVALAKAELRQALDKIIAGATLAAIGAVLASTGLNALVASAILGLSTIWAPWLAALVVGLAIIIVGAILAMAGLRNLRSAELMPERTVRTLQDDVRTVKGDTP